MKNNAAVYFRCSTDKQDKSIADQRTVLEDYARDQNLIITTWFDQDEGKSGTSFEKRSDFMRMVRLVESGRHDFSQILVYDVDRWGRPVDPDESAYWEFHLRRFGVTVHYVSDDSVNDNTMAGRLTKKIKQELATEESRKQSVRVRERSKMRAKQGFRVGGFAPYGYKRLLVTADGKPIRTLEHGERKAEKSQRVILTPGDPKEIEIVHRIYKMKISGMGVRAITNTLNRGGVPAPSARRVYAKVTPGKWGINSVWRILRSPIYVGNWTYNRQVRGSWAKVERPGSANRDEVDLVTAKGTHEAIISPEMYAKVNAIGKQVRGMRPSGMSYRSTYLLSGLVRCASCGYNFHGHTKSVGGKKYRYYEDSGFNLHGSEVCSQAIIPADRIETFILNALGTRIKPKVNENRLRKLISKRLSIQTEDDEASDTKKLIADVDRRIENIKDSIEQGLEPKFMADRIKKLDNEKAGLETKLKSIPANKHTDLPVDEIVNKLMAVADNAFEDLGSSSPQKSKDALRVLIDRVEVDPKAREAVFYVNQIPQTAKGYAPDLPVTSCRRSDLNRQGIATGGF